MSVCWRSGKATLSNTDIEPNRAPSWKSTPILRRSASSLGIVRLGTDCPSTIDVAGVGEHQPDDVLDQHALAGPRRAEHDRDRVVGEGHVQPVEDGHPAEALVHVHAADRPVARVRVAAEVELVGVVLEWSSASLMVCHRRRRAGTGSVCPLNVNGPCWLQRRRRHFVGRFRLVGDFELDAAVRGSALGDRFVCRAR